MPILVLNLGGIIALHLIVAWHDRRCSPLAWALMGLPPPSWVRCLMKQHPKEKKKTPPPPPPPKKKPPPPRTFKIA